MEYELDQVTSLNLDDVQSMKACMWALEHFMPYLTGRKQWNDSSLGKNLSNFVSISDEAFMLINLENQWVRWYSMYLAGATRKSNVETLYTSLVRNQMAENTPRNLCRKFGGWNAAGMKKFNYYLKLIKNQRKNRTDIEEDWRIAWNQKADLELSRKRKRVVKRLEKIEMAGNDLFPDEDDCSVDEEAIRREASASTVAMATNVTHA